MNVMTKRPTDPLDRALFDLKEFKAAASRLEESLADPALRDLAELRSDEALFDDVSDALDTGASTAWPMAVADDIADGASPLRAWRKARGMTQKDLSDKTGLAQGYISQIESGEKTNASTDALGRLAAALDVGIADLLVVE